MRGGLQFPEFFGEVMCFKYVSDGLSVYGVDLPMVTSHTYDPYIPFSLVFISMYNYIYTKSACFRAQPPLNKEKKSKNV